MEIVVYKSKRKLELWEGQELLGCFPIGVGRSEFGHKTKEGDQRTPEGTYRVCVKNPKSKFYLSLGLNYPNNEDALAGFKAGIINEEQYQEICRRNDAGSVPLWDTPLGGQIYIHGDLESDPWSEGCIRMYRADIEFLFQKVEKGTPVRILP